MNIYNGNFANWSDVQNEFLMDMAEPDRVYYASYDTPAYEGYANVIYRNGNTLYWVYGSHCSCYGLEDQWEPEAYEAPDLLAALRKGSAWQFDSYGKSVKEELIAQLEEYIDDYVNAGHA